MNFAAAENFISVEADGQRYKTITLSRLELDLGGTSDRLSPFGGSMDLSKQASTGFFRVENINGIWTFIDPEGCVFISIGVNSVNEGGRELRINYQERFKDTGEWLEHVDTLMVDLGFNTYANWSDYRKLKVHKRPYTARFSFIASYAKLKGKAEMGYGNFLFENDVMPVFDSEFESYSMQQAKELSMYKDDPYLLGVFSDNELAFNKIDGCIKAYLSFGADDEGCQFATQWLRKEGIGESEITQGHDQQFMETVIERYFSVVSRALKEYLPNHLYLGTRFHGKALRNDALFRVSGPFLDVVSVNYYHRWTPEYDRLNRWAELAGKPLMMTEFYAKAQDSGLDNLMGAGFLVKSQQDRAHFYENYCLGLLRNRNVVGWHWFRYADDMKEGEQANKGIVDQNFERYEVLSKSVMTINKNAYKIRRHLITSNHSLLLNLPEKAN